MTMMKRFCMTMTFLLAAHGGGSAQAATTQEPRTSFALICAEREVQVITLLEDHADAQLLSSDTLGAAGLTRMEAQSTCYQGRIVEAVGIYDGIIARLGPALARATR